MHDALQCTCRKTIESLVVVGNGTGNRLIRSAH